MAVRGLVTLISQAFGQRRSMSWAMLTSTGMWRRARKKPPGPTVSPTVWKMPCFSGTARSSSQRSTPPTLMLTTTKSAPRRASPRSVVSSMAMSAPLWATIRRQSAATGRWRSGATSMRATLLPCSSGVRQMSRTRFLVHTALPPPMKARRMLLSVPTEADYSINLPLRAMPGSSAIGHCQSPHLVIASAAKQSLSWRNSEIASPRYFHVQ